MEESKKDNQCPTSINPKASCPVSVDPKLIADGWQMRFYGDKRMADNAKETYEQLNLEVRLERVALDAKVSDCSGCATSFDDFSLVYTRKKK